MSAAAQYAFALPLEPSYAEEDFIVSDANREAFALVTQSAMSPVMAISGPQGAGKTHLAHIFAGRHDTKFVVPEELGRTTADAILGRAGALVIEQVERVREEEALAQLINEIHARGRRLLLTGRTPLGTLAFARPDLTSRLKAAHQVVLAAPDDALMTALLAKGFADRQLRVSGEAIAYLVRRIERSASAAADIVEKLDTSALVKGQAITIPLIREIL